MIGPKEAVYDAEISPLMAQIVAICKAHKINMAATFALDPADEEGNEGPMFRTTVLPVDPTDEDGHKRIMDCRRAFTITKGA